MNTHGLRNGMVLLVLAGGATAVFGGGGAVISEIRKVIADDGQSGDNYGRSIAAEVSMFVVGANLDDDDGVDSGSVYVHSVGLGTQMDKLKPAFGSAGAEFGTSVAINNSLVFGGAPFSDSVVFGGGGLYEFDAAGDEAWLFGSSDLAMDDQFGYSVAVDDDYVVVGAWGNTDSGLFTGAVYVYSAVNRLQLHKLLPADAAMNNFIGWDVAIDDGVIAIGSPVNFVDGIEVGAVYLYDALTGLQFNKLSPNDPDEFDQFGYSVDMEDGIVVIGSRFDDDHGTDSGSVYVFDAASGQQTHKLLPEITGRTQGNLGQDVAIHNGIIAAGSPGESGLGNIEAGAAYVFESFTGNELARVLVSDGDTGDAFGTSLALRFSRLTVGAPMEDENGTDAGAVYQFILPGSGCEGDLNYDGSLDFFDVSQFLSAFGAMHPTADFNDDGVWDFFDVSAFLEALTDC